MNSYTLRFRNNSLEELYKKGENSYLQYCVIMAISISGFFLGVGDFFSHLDQIGRMDSLMSLVTAIYFFFQALYVWRFKSHMQVGLFMTNLILVTFQISIPNTYNLHDAYLFGANDMMIHATVYFVQSFYSGIAANASLCTARLLLTYYNTVEMNIGQYIYTIASSLLFMFVQYQIEKDKRLNYLLNLKDNSKEVIFPQVFQKPFYIFTMDPIDYRFSVNLSNTDNSMFNINFTQFIEDSIFNKQSLKNYIYQQAHIFATSFTDKFQMALTYKFQDKKERLTFYAFKLEQNYFVLTLDSHNQYFIEQIKRHDKKIKSIQLSFTSVLKQMSTASLTFIQRGSIQLAIKYRLSLIQFQMFLQHQKEVELQHIDIQELLSQLTKYTQKMSLKINHQARGKVMAYNIRSKLLIFLIEVIKNRDLRKPLTLQAIKLESKFIIEFHGMTQLPKTKLFNQFSQLLVHRTTRLKNGITLFYFFQRICSSILQKAYVIFHACTFSRLSEKLIQYQIMNKYTLKFLNKNLESEYQKQFEQVHYILFTSLQIGAFLLISIKLIFNLVEEDLLQIYIGSPALIYLVLQQGLVYKKKRFAKGGIIMLNLFIMAFQIQMKIGDRQLNFMFGQNQMGVLSFVLFSLDFKESIAINLFSTIYRLVIANLLSDKISFWDTLYGIIVFLYFSICLYYKTLFMKRFFLYSLKDNIYEKIIPQLATKPTFIFTFDNEQLQFKEKKLMLGNFLLKQEQKLHHFLRVCKFNSETLEQFLFKKIKKVAHTHNYQVSRIQVVYGKNTLRIILTELYLDSMYYILLVDQEIETNALQLLNSVKQIQQLKVNFITLLKTSVKIIDMTVKKQDLKLLNILRTRFIQQILILLTPKLSDVDLNQFIRSMVNIYGSRFVFFEQDIENGECGKCHIRINKRLLRVFFLELFQLIKQQYLMKIKSENNIFYLIIINQNSKQSLFETDLQSRLLFIWVAKRLFEKYNFKNGQHIFQFSQEPMSAFRLENE